MPVIEYECDDGTPFPVRFDDDAQAALTWRLDREHNRDPLTPLGQSTNRLGAPGLERAYREVGLLAPPFFRPGPDALGFPYFSDAPLGAEEMRAMVEGCRVLVERHGSALAIWHERCLPQTKAVHALIDAADLNSPWPTIAEQLAYGFHMTMIPAFVCSNDIDLLAASIRSLFGDDARRVALELTQGYDNATLAADQRLWELGRHVARDSVLAAAVRSPDPSAAIDELVAGGSERAVSFVAELDRFLDEFGGRCEGWDIALPTWQERGAGFWSLLGHVSRSETGEPAAAVARAAKRREALASDISLRLADDREALDRFQRRYERAAAYVAVREERALWQVMLQGAARRAALRRGHELVRQGVVTRSDDTLFLDGAELDAALAGGTSRDGSTWQALIDQRRAEHERWRRLSPPAVIGGASATSPESGRPQAAASDDSVSQLRGAAASAGVAEGTARVITDLSEADRLDPGEILVCVMTAPPWTPLFGIAAAVIASSGDLGSHPAIAAREYGIPCVLGVRDATSVIPDGAQVRVDGDRGEVEILSG